MDEAGSAGLRLHRMQRPHLRRRAEQVLEAWLAEAAHLLDAVVHVGVEERRLDGGDPAAEAAALQRSVKATRLHRNEMRLALVALCFSHRRDIPTRSPP